MNTYITIHISKRKKIQLTIDEAQRLYMQLADWLNPRVTIDQTDPKLQTKQTPDSIAELLQLSAVKAYTPPQ